MPEVWRALTEFPNYAVSNTGRVINTQTDLIKRPSRNQQGIAIVNMWSGGNQTVRSVAVLVACAFLPRPAQPHFDTPIHLDGNKYNCAVSNLMWRPRWFAVRYHKQFYPSERANHPGFRRPVLIEQTEEVFPTSWEAAIKYGLLDREIFLSTLNNTVVFPYGFKFVVLSEPYI